jgi:hypothetical protein
VFFDSLGEDEQVLPAGDCIEEDMSTLLEPFKMSHGTPTRANDDCENEQLVPGYSSKMLN